MRFRIKTYYDRYMPQVFEELSGWSCIGSPNGYATVKEAKNFCNAYKNRREAEIIEEFVL